MAKKLKTFNVTGYLRVEVGIDIEAGSWEEAVAEARTLEEGDFVSFKGEFIDSEPLKISTIYDKQARDD